MVTMQRAAVSALVTTAELTLLSRLAHGSTAVGARQIDPAKRNFSRNNGISRILPVSCSSLLGAACQAYR